MSVDSLLKSQFSEYVIVDDNDHALTSLTEQHVLKEQVGISELLLDSKLTDSPELNMIRKSFAVDHRPALHTTQTDLSKKVWGTREDQLQTLLSNLQSIEITPKNRGELIRCLLQLPTTESSEQHYLTGLFFTNLSLTFIQNGLVVQYQTAIDSLFEQVARQYCTFMEIQESDIREAINLLKQKYSGHFFVTPLPTEITTFSPSIACINNEQNFKDFCILRMNPVKIYQEFIMNAGVVLMNDFPPSSKYELSVKLKSKNGCSTEKRKFDIPQLCQLFIPCQHQSNSQILNSSCHQQVNIPSTSPTLYYLQCLDVSFAAILELLFSSLTLDKLEQEALIMLLTIRADYVDFLNLINLVNKSFTLPSIHPLQLDIKHTVRNLSVSLQGCDSLCAHINELTNTDELNYFATNMFPSNLQCLCLNRLHALGHLQINDERLLSQYALLHLPTEMLSTSLSQSKKNALLFTECQESKRSETIKTLITIGAEVNAKDASGLTPLLHICRQCESAHIESIKVLLAAGADSLSTECVSGITPFHHLCIRGFSDLQLQICKQHPLELDKLTTKTHLRPTHLACYDLSGKTLYFLLNQPDVEIYPCLNEKGENLLEACCSRGNINGVKLLTAGGFYRNKLIIEKAQMKLQSNVKPPKQKAEILRYFEQLLGGLPITSDHAQLKQVVFTSQRKGHDISQLTLIELNKQLHRSIDSQNQGLALICLQNGAKLSARDITGQTVLHKLVRVDDTLSKCVLSFTTPEDILLTNKHKQTVLHLCVLTNCIENLIALLGILEFRFECIPDKGFISYVCQHGSEELIKSVITHSLQNGTDVSKISLAAKTGGDRNKKVKASTINALVSELTFKFDLTAFGNPMFIPDALIASQQAQEQQKKAEPISAPQAPSATLKLDEEEWVIY
ncbi:MAG: hypothetical protein ACPGUD_07305 [Parashewanella sp.]